MLMTGCGNSARKRGDRICMYRASTMSSTSSASSLSCRPPLRPWFYPKPERGETKSPSRRRYRRGRMVLITIRMSTFSSPECASHRSSSSAWSALETKIAILLRFPASTSFQRIENLSEVVRTSRRDHPGGWLGPAGEIRPGGRKFPRPGSWSTVAILRCSHPCRRGSANGGDDSWTVWAGDQQTPDIPIYSIGRTLGGRAGQASPN